MKYFFGLLIICSLLPRTIHSQIVSSSTYDNYNRLVVAIQTERNESGSGFLFAADADMIYILTANHVVENLETVNVSFFSNQYDEVGTVIGQNSYYDVAVVAVPNSRRFPWSPISAIQNPKGGTPVFCITVRRDRQVLNNKNRAIITSINNEEITTNTNINEGDSGTPLFSASGVIGMIFKQPGTARPIGILYDLVSSWKLPWQLPLTEIKDVVQYEPKKPERAKILPIVSVVDKGSGTKYRFISDNSTVSGHTFKKAENRVKIVFDSPVGFEEIRIFCPNEKDVDIPSNAFFHFPGEPKPIRVTKVRQPVMLRGEKGNWVVYRLDKVYKGDSFELSFKLVQENKKLIPHTLYELAVFGTKIPSQ
jgi:hypothetical protein